MRKRGRDGELAAFLVARASEVEPFTFEESPLPAGAGQGKTYADMTREEVFHSLPALREDTRTSFLEANAKTHNVSGVERFAKRLRLVDETELHRLFSGGTDEGFVKLFERYPETDSLLTMSMPGISGDGTQALLYVSLLRDGLDGTGHYVLLSREGRRWKVEENVQVWIA